MAGLGPAFIGKESTAEQLFIWQVLGQIVAAGLAPLFNEVARLANKALPSTPLTPAELADMVNQHIVEYAQGADYASQSGIEGQDFTRLVAAAGNAPSPQELELALRRQLIPESGRGPDSISFEQGVAESRIRDKWTQVIKALGRLPIGPADAVDAVVEGQIDYAQGEAEAFLSGIDADRFRILVNTRGRPPDPTQLNSLLKRGLIPLEGTGPDALSVQQGIFEGATKDKWWRLLAALSEYIPPPRTVTAMVREGAISDEDALTYFQHAGLSPKLAGQYLTAAHHQRTANTRNLTVAAILQLYEDRIIDQKEAGDLLMALNYSQQDAQFELELADFRVLRKALDSAVGRIQTLFVNHKIDVTQATTALDGLHIPPTGRDQLLQTWQLEAAANVQLPTVAVILGAIKLGFLSPDDGATRLVQRGYSLDDARLEISVHLKVNPWAPPPAGRAA